MKVSTLRSEFLLSFLTFYVCCGSNTFDEDSIAGVIYREHRLFKRSVNVSEMTTVNASDTMDTTERTITSTLQPDDTTTPAPEITTVTEMPVTKALDTTSQTTAAGLTTVTAEPTNTTTVIDHHTYYKSRRFVDPDGLYWNDMNGHTRHTLSDDKHLVYSFVSMSFEFPFYGHPINRFAITPLGFLYMSSFVHPDLDFAYTHYIAPLMANFDTIGNYSDILYKDDGNSFVIEWRNVELNDQADRGNYTFQTTLFKNGTIMFVYKTIPDTNISGDVWPVKVGISDAFYMDISTVFGYFRYIFRYHSVPFNVNDLRDSTVIILDPVPTCNQGSTCEICTTRQTDFQCSWCHAVSRCSDGLDWHRQDWISSKCDENGVTSLGQCNITTNAQPSNGSPSPSNPDAVFTSDDKDNSKSEKTKSREGKAKTAVIVVAMISAVVLIVVFIVACILYARANPNSKTGRWFIEHRPSRLKDKFTSVSFSKDKSDQVKIKSKYESDELPEVVSNT